jgi:hypothetical protein
MRSQHEEFIAAVKKGEDIRSFLDSGEIFINYVDKDGFTGSSESLSIIVTSSISSSLGC